MEDKEKKAEWIEGWHQAGLWFVPAVRTDLSMEDRLGGLKVRWGIGRMTYMVMPGLYAVGKPDGDSPVLVTANYKLTFDSLRKELKGIKAWIVVLDTKGVNVWCAAGKGTFGTEEVIRRINAVNLAAVVRHKTVILPQLGGPGVAAHLVTKATGFRVIYGPVRAVDLPRFLAQGMKADKQMRRVSFTLRERLAVTPVDLIQSWKIAAAAVLFHLISSYGLGKETALALSLGALPYVGAVVMGCVVVPAMLPWIPGRSFALKGWLAGLAGTICFSLLYGGSSAEKAVYLLILPAISAYFALNFTGATPYTSLSGVKKEMRYGLPLLIISALAGVILRIFDLWRSMI